LRSRFRQIRVQGFIDRSGAASDRRYKLVNLTAAGIYRIGRPRHRAASQGRGHIVKPVRIWEKSV
jgi:hypothetical protein